MFIVLTYFWLRWVLLHILLSFTIHYFIFHFKCYSNLHFAVCQLLFWAFLLKLCWHPVTNVESTFLCDLFYSQGRRLLRHWQAAVSLPVRAAVWMSELLRQTFRKLGSQSSLLPARTSRTSSSSADTEDGCVQRANCSFN